MLKSVIAECIIATKSVRGVNVACQMSLKAKASQYNIHLSFSLSLSLFLPSTIYLIEKLFKKDLIKLVIKMKFTS